jgi:hypothetical protein
MEPGACCLKPAACSLQPPASGLQPITANTGRRVAVMWYNPGKSRGKTGWDYLKGSLT